MSSSFTDADSVTRPASDHPAHLCREYVLNPITALAFFTSSTDGRIYLLVGEDNHVNVYDVLTSVLCGGLPVFHAQSIHGIAVTPKDAVKRRVLVWGGHSVAVLPGETLEALVSTGTSSETLELRVVRKKTPDWIFDGILSPYDGDFVLLTAHNEAIKAQCVGSEDAVEFKEIVSPSRPILYSGNLSWETKDCVLVAAGSVFGEILVWKYHIGSQACPSSCEVLFVFAGHEGSIFGVHISSPFQLGNGDTMRLLASCSDDRTIRVWDITDGTEVSQSSQNEYHEKIMAARQTGFGDSVEAPSQENISTRCLAVVMGHISRIWQVEFPPNQPTIRKSSSIELWSFGEDATAQKWTMSLNDLATVSPSQSNARHVIPTSTGWQLKNQAIISTHSGKQIWSHAIIQDKAGELLIATGGADGKISFIGDIHESAIGRDLSDVPHAVASESSFTETYDNSEQEPDVATSGQEITAAYQTSHPQAKIPSKKPKSKPKNESFRRYAFLSDGRLLAVTDAGRFFIGGSEVGASWKELSIPNDLSPAMFSYSVVKTSSTSPMAFVGTAGGDILIYRDSGSSALETLTKVHGKVADMFSLSNHSNYAKLQASQEAICVDMNAKDAPVLLLVTVLGSSNASLLEIDMSDGGVVRITKKVVIENGFIVTSAVLFLDYLIIGSRKGFISILRSCEDEIYRSSISVEASINDTVTSITMLPPRADQTDEATYFLATSRDGKYRIYSLQGTDADIELTLLHETSPPFGPMIEGAWFSTSQDGGIDLILCGFRSKDFVVWNESQYREIATIDCGGGHRTVAHMPLTSYPEGFRFAHTKATKLFFFSQTHAPHRVLKVGGHGREIKAVSSSGKYIATAAEDTTIRIWSYDCRGHQKESGLQCLAVMEKHTAGIQTLKWHEQSHIFSSGGNEEFFVWRVSHLDSAYQRLAIKCEAVFLDRTEDGDLRIMDFDVHCLDKTSDDGHLFYISMALSNSALQSYAYSEKKGFQLISRGSYSGACLTQLRHLHVDTTSIRTLTAATDGHMAIWEANDLTAGSEGQTAEHTCIHVTRLHQSTIKSLDMRQLRTETGTSYLVITGGDDNALGLLHLHTDGTSQEFVVKSKSIVRPAHAAAVTGIAILKTTAGGREATVVSVSNDQRVKKWKIVNWQSSNGARVSLVGNQYSSIADAGDLEVLENGRVMVGGVGLEVWDAAST
jgi:WD40 repeat protein